MTPFDKMTTIIDKGGGVLDTNICVFVNLGLNLRDIGVHNKENVHVLS